MLVSVFLKPSTSFLETVTIRIGSGDSVFKLNLQFIRYTWLMRAIGILANSLSGGGAEKASKVLYDALQSRGYEVYFIGINSENPGKIKLKGNVICLGRDNKKSIRVIFQTFLKLLILIRKNRIEALIVNCELPELYAALLPIPIKLFIVEQANPSWFQRNILGFAIRKILIFRNSQFVVTGSHLKSRFVYTQDPICIPNPIEFAKSKDLLTSNNSIKRLVYIGRLSRHFKNPEVLLEIAVRTQLPVCFIGDGELRENLMNLAIKGGVLAEFRGFQTNPWGQFEPGDLLIIPSSAEGDGLILMEALHHRAPFLAQNIPDFKRYGISQIHYCNDVPSYVEVIESNRHSLNKLVVPEEMAKHPLQQRNPTTIAERWINILQV
jgi:GalNAc-alpha-(1->4)-GalNAc-alpha-(1->3)-diNAcBac-PP-undecaprenol alpha-1,4-N-acetyl-D-galactosaminyltransferase